jgi:hypothetical protein
MQIVCQTHGVGEGEVICSKCVELAEQKINNLQQLKAEIAALCNSFVKGNRTSFLDEFASKYERLRQLSAV